MKYELSDQVKNNLLIFLKRTSLSGEEVGAYLDILTILNTPVESKEAEIPQNKNPINQER